MKQILSIECGDEVLRALGLSPEEFSEEIPLLTALKLYEMGRLSSGAAAAFAGMSKPMFLARLAEYGANSFHLTEEELRQELTNAHSHL